MLRRILALCMCLSAISYAVFAGGRQDNESHDVDEPSGFTETVDIREKQPGKWNIYVEAQDKGGNVTVAGPHNLYIDPVSDLPVARVINPKPDMHVQGNLNIVGTCYDDDGVDYVELEVSRGADGKGEVLARSKAEGSDFWSFFLDTSNTEIWRDGMYTVTAWGVDINGLSGVSDTFPEKSRKKHQVVWNLDRKKPEINVTSHHLGALLRGKVSIRGTVWDGNGVESLSYSLDNGFRYFPVKLKTDKSGNSSYEISVDTRIFDDGPAVILFRARDNMKSEGAFSFLMFANNTGPKVQILYPDPNEAVNGIFTVAGHATHSVGIASLSWRLGKETGDLPLTTGNPWWVKEFDIRGMNAKNLELEIRAVDQSGNVTVVRRRLAVDQEADLPKISLNGLAAGMVVPDTGLPLAGVAADDDGVKSVHYSFDGGPESVIPTTGNFQVFVTDIPAGAHTLDVWAEDITGVMGKKTTIKNIISPGMAPQPQVTQVHTGSGKNVTSANFYSGMELSGEGDSQLQLAIESGSALKSVKYQYGSGSPAVIQVKGSKGGSFTQNIPVPASVEKGLVRLELTVTDIHDREAVYSEYLFIAGGNPQTFTWVRPNNSLGDGRILLSANEALMGLYDGRAIQSVAVTGENTSSITVSADQYGRVSLKASSDGNYGPLQLVLTSGGREITTPEYRIIADSAAPALELAGKTGSPWVQNTVQLKFSASDSNKIKSLEYCFNYDGSWRSLPQGSEADFEQAIDISSCPDGTVYVVVRAIDEANKATVKSFPVNKDTIAPVGQLIVPISEARVNGTIRLGILIKESGQLASAAYQRPAGELDGKAVEAISKQLYPVEGRDMPLAFLDVLLDSDIPLSENMTFVFADAAGNSSVLSDWPFAIDRETDLPIVQISLPLENEVVYADFIVSGVCFDDDEVKNIYYRVDDGEEMVLETKHGYSINIPLSYMTDNEHSVTIYAEDIFGVKGNPAVRTFRVSLEEPQASIAAPALGEIVGGVVKISGIASDKNGIKGVYVSLDNGNSYNEAVIAGGGDGSIKAAAEWGYQFNSKVLQDSTHVVFVRVMDNYSISSLYSSMLIIDNTPPELVVDSPGNGDATTGPVYITGRAIDNIQLEKLSIKLSSLEGVSIPPDMAFAEAKLDALMLEHMDISALPNGVYNIEIFASDKAHNITQVSRNVTLVRDKKRNSVEILYPLDGEHVQGHFDLYGNVGGIDAADSVVLLINDAEVMTGTVTEAGYFHFSLSSGTMEAGSNKMTVLGNFSGIETILSEPRVVNYQPYGPWVTVDTMNMGDFAYARPWLMGRAGYELTEEEQAMLKDKSIDRDTRAALESKRVESIELSFDNGRSFTATRKSSEKAYDWRYRIEDGEIREGLHYLVVRASMVNGEKAVTRMLVQVDKTAPIIRLISPEKGGSYNDEMQFAALASDDVELKSMSYHLRAGDKASYEVPVFLRGMYTEATIPPFLKHLWHDAPGFLSGGATYMDMGLGLSFFDDNVKIQVNYGFLTDALYTSMGGVDLMRYGGNVFGIKLLASVYNLPFKTYFGPDWAWLQASFAFGANFSLFSTAQSGQATWLSALLMQIEFPKATIPNRTYLRTFSLFTEGQLWFSPTDVLDTDNPIPVVIPKLVLGLRVYFF